jgi:hypothetical protein
MLVASVKAASDKVMGAARRKTPSRYSPALLLAIATTSAGCVGGRFATNDPGKDLGGANLDPSSRLVVDRIAAERAARHLTAASWMPELRPPAVRAAMAVVRGEQSLKTGAHLAAQQAVTEVGRHVWTFIAECTDLLRFRPPLMALEEKTLILGAAAISAPGGRTIVLLVIAEPGPSSLRADQIGGGTGGTNPSLETYAHPSVATGTCGESWPAAQRTPL